MRIQVNLSKPTTKKIILGDYFSFDQKVFFKIVGIGWNSKKEIDRITIENSKGEMFI